MSRKLKLLICSFIFLITFLPIRIEASQTNNVKDFLNYLSETQVKKLQSKIDEISSKYNLDTVIVITDNTNGKSSMDYADDFYDNNNYGLDKEQSGVLMLINMNAREVWISTTGKAINIFNDNTINTMVNDITKYLSDKDYYGASSKFLEKVNYYTKSNSTPTSYASRLKDKATSLSSYIIPLIISIVATLIATYNSKWKVTVDSKTYEGNGSFNLTNKKDIFVSENTTRTKIEKNPSNNSTTHKSSSGKNHGGGGGSF